MIPDFTGKYESYADRNNNLLKSFLNKFKFDYSFISSTDYYKNGKFDKQLLKILENYESIINIILPTLRKERKKATRHFYQSAKKLKKSYKFL